MKIVLYSCISGDYDDMVDVSSISSSGIECVMFHSKLSGVLNGWDVRRLTNNRKIEDSTLVNRLYKFLGLEMFPEADVVVYMDGNVNLRCDLSIICDEFMASDLDFAAFRHPAVRTWEQEVLQLLKVGKLLQEDSKLINSQRYWMERDGIPEIKNVFATRLLIRRNSLSVRKVMRSWWAKYCLFTHRDQLTIDWTLLTSDLNVGDLETFQSITYSDLDLTTHKQGMLMALLRRAIGFIGR